MPELEGSSSLPEGNYTIVGVDIDTTGRRLIDEIVHLSAYTPDSQYSQYVMPYMNLNPAARQRHQVRVITIGFFRMLKSMQTYKVMKTKPEFAALTDFLEWLEAKKAANEDSKGLILLYHEQRNFVPYMILEAVKKYSMLSRFQQCVVGFSNMYPLAEKECGNSLKYFTLKELAKLILKPDDDDKNEFEGSAQYRSRVTYQVARELANKESKKADSEVKQDPEAAAVVPEGEEEKKPEVIPEVKVEVVKSEEEKESTFNRVIVNMATTVEENIRELDGQQTILDRQNSLRSIFINYFKTTLYHRVKGVTYRRVLAEKGYDMAMLEDIWTREKRDGVTRAVSELEELKEEDKTELIDLLDCHFDPDKQPIKPAVKKPNKRRFQNRRAPRMSPRRQIQGRKKSGPPMGNGQRNGGGGNQQQQNGQHQGNRRGTPQKKHSQRDFQAEAVALPAGQVA